MGLKCTLANPARRNIGRGNGGTGRIIEEIQVWFFSSSLAEQWVNCSSGRLQVAVNWNFFSMASSGLKKTSSLSYSLNHIIKLASQILSGLHCIFAGEKNVPWWLHNKAILILCDRLPQNISHPVSFPIEPPHSFVIHDSCATNTSSHQKPRV